jgi:hypothetical protein
MRNRRKRVRRRDGSVYVTKTKRDMWKSRRVGVNRMIQGSMDWTKQLVWMKKLTESKRKEGKETRSQSDQKKG